MKFEEHVPIAPFTTFRVGGAARFLCVVSTVNDLAEAMSFAAARKLPVFVLGGGSNILVSDDGFPGLVIKNEMRGMAFGRRDGTSVVEAGAGESWDALVEACVSRGLWGLENLSLIPGTVGAAPVQNIGAYGTEAKDHILSVSVFDMKTGKERLLSNAECLFGYRDSVFKRLEQKSLVITRVTFALSEAPRPNLSYKDLKERFPESGQVPSLRDIRDAIISIRTSKFPDLSVLGTAGSFWKNPVITPAEFERMKRAYPGMPSYPAQDGMVKVSLAWILDNICGLKGYREGRVRLFERQPLVLSAEFGATEGEIDAFARNVEAKIKKDAGIQVEREAESVGVSMNMRV